MALYISCVAESKDCIFLLSILTVSVWLYSTHVQEEVEVEVLMGGGVEEEGEVRRGDIFISFDIHFPSFIHLIHIYSDPISLCVIPIIPICTGCC